MNHKKYLKVLLDEAATKFGIVCFLLAIFVSPLMSVGGEYVSAITYFGALGSLYWSSYSVWAREKQSGDIEKSKDLNINPIASEIKFSSGNGYTFHKASMRIELGISNDTDCGVSLSEIRLNANTASDRVSLEKSFKIIDEENGIYPIKSINLKSGQSKIISLYGQLVTTFKTSLETANYLSENEEVMVTVTYKSVTGKEVVERSIELAVSTQDLAQYFGSEWSRNGQNEALSIIA
ncbi:hypothetical protein L5M36_22275 [Shewanella sp. SM72]|uniref:hypothetical protein n=1 Tax=Shewanella TaxID=22 RepID=UPI0021DAB81C|nr:hypothetical protein [Shewanella sp. SM72]MCU8019581.1 hypothetical protein [Shewanella sp. SM72]